MLNIVANFLLALIATLLVSWVAKWVAGKFTAESAKVASFAVGCGYALGKYSFVKPASADITNNVAALAGALLALVVLWVLLFRKKNHAPT